MRDINEILNHELLNSYLVIKSLNPLVVKAQAFECAAKVRDLERSIIDLLSKEFLKMELTQMIEYKNPCIDDFFEDNYGIKICEGMECHELFNNNQNFYNLASMFFEFDYQPRAGEESMYQRQKDAIVAELRDRKITDLLTEK